MRGLGPDIVFVVLLTSVYSLDFFCSGIQLYVLLSPYLCLSPFYLNMNVLGEDTLISYFMRTKHLCVLIHIRNKGEVGTVKHV